MVASSVTSEFTPILVPASGVDKPDPTAAVNAAVERAVSAERDYVNGQIKVLEERLRGIDVATRLLNESVNRVPTDIQKETANLSAVVLEKFVSIALQFSERDTRSERESRDNKVAVDAAFAAQKEAAAKQDEANQKAIDKSEKATAETITKLGELFQSTTDAINGKIDDVKVRMNALEISMNSIIAAGGAARDTRSEHRQGISSAGHIIGIITGVFGLLVLIIGLVLASRGITTSSG